MDSLLAAIRARLLDGSLNEIVAHNDITASYNSESANYPCIVLSIIGGGSNFEVAGITRATLQIDIYSRTNKQELWTAYNCVKSLLHNQESSISTLETRLHAIYETFVDDSPYGIESDAWHLIATYSVLFSSMVVSVVTAVGGKMYADENNVTADSWKQVAEFRGVVAIDMGYESIARTGQERFGKAVYYKAGLVDILIEEVIFDPVMLYKLWGVTYSTSDTLADDSTAATSYIISQSTFPRTLQLLLKFTCPGLHLSPATGDMGGKIMEIQANRSVCRSLIIPFPKRDIVVAQCHFQCYADSSDNVIKVAVEN